MPESQDAMTVLAAPLSGLPLALALAVVVLAGVVRGFSGFGFSAISVAGLSLMVSPTQVVPAVFLLEVFASLRMLRGNWQHVDIPWLGWLVLGNAIALPVGIVLLAYLPERALRLLIGALLALSAVLLRSGVAARLEPTRGVRLLAGLVSGFIGGVAAIGGIAVAVMLSATALTPAALRATLIVLLLFTDVYALAWAGLLTWTTDAPHALLGGDTLRWALWLLPAMLAGMAIGQRGFHGLSPLAFRRRVLEMLIAVAALTVLRAALAFST